MTISEELARYAYDVSFSDLSPAEIQGSKRSILDLLACAFGGYEADSSKIVRDLIAELGGREESTVVGSGIKSPCSNAALANGAMARYLDYNDTYNKITDEFFTGWHPNELIPAALAVGERQHSTGREVITAVALGYEIIGRFVDATLVKGLGSRGWHMASLAGFVIPLYVGKLLGLSPEQMVHAMGIAGTYSPTLGIIDAPGEENNMTKNIGNPFVARNCITATLLAEKGFTGPNKAIEGNRGFLYSVVAGELDIGILLKRRDSPIISQTITKYYPIETYALGSIAAILKLVIDHNILPEQIESVRLQLSTFGAEHIGDPIKRHPRNKETADHSLHYLAAVAIVDRTVNMDSYSEAKLKSPVINSLIDKINVEGNPELNKFVLGGIAQICTHDHREVSCRIDHPKGHYDNPMTNEEMAEKFRAVALKFMSGRQIEKIVQTVYQLEEVADISELMRMLAFK